MLQKKKIENILKLELDRVRRYSTNLSFILIGIDNLKQINELKGDEESDKTLVSLADIFRSNMRTTDFLGRWDLNKFLIICSETNLKHATRFSEKLERFIKENKNNISISFGITQAKEWDKSNKILNRLNEVLNKSKNSEQAKISFI